MKLVIAFLLLLGAFSCVKGPTKASLPNSKELLYHQVFFKLKPDAPLEKMVETLNALGQIPQVKDISIGTYKNLGDTRALSEYQLTMLMIFENQEDYLNYQKHPLHLRSIESSKAYLAGPPSSFDFTVKK